MDPDGSRLSIASGGDVRRRLRLRLGLRLLAAAEGRSRPGYGAPPGTARRLPSVRAVAEAAGVHRNTAAAVYRDLERFGLVCCVRGAGTFAVEFPAHPLPGGPDLVCRAVDMADVLAAELGRPVPVATPGVPGGPLLVPLDESPPSVGVVMPVAPVGPALHALRRLGPGSAVRLVSASPRLGRLVRHTILALHGDAVGFARTPDARVASAAFGPVGADLGLIDLRQVERCGTDVPPEGLIPLRLLMCAGRPAG